MNDDERGTEDADVKPEEGEVSFNGRLNERQLRDWCERCLYLICFALETFLCVSAVLCSIFCSTI